MRRAPSRSGAGHSLACLTSRPCHRGSRRTRSSTRLRRSSATTASGRRGAGRSRRRGKEVGGASDELHELGRRAGSASAQEVGRQANENPPVLRTHDRYGNRIDVVRYHPAYHELMTVAVRHGLHAAPWADPQAGAHVVRAAKVITWYQVDGGHVCPISMTYSAVPALRHAPELAAVWEPRLASRAYDPANRPAGEKDGATCGMAMTEKQGGSDVRANTTICPRDGRRLRAHRPQVVLLRADVGCVPHARPGTGWSVVLPRPALAARWRAAIRFASNVSRTSSATVRTRRARSSWSTRGARASATRARCAHDHRDGQPHPSRLCAGFDRDHAPRCRASRRGTRTTAPRSGSCSTSNRS